MNGSVPQFPHMPSACVGTLYHISFLYNNRLDTGGGLRFQLCVGSCNRLDTGGGLRFQLCVGSCNSC